MTRVEEPSTESLPDPAEARRLEQAKVKRFQSSLHKFGSIVMACGVLVWVAFNIQYNIMDAQHDPESSSLGWLTTSGILLLLCGIPCMLGIYWLTKTIKA